MDANREVCRKARTIEVIFAVAWLVLFLAAGPSGCRKIEATGERHLTLVGEEQEREMGAQSDAQIVETIGLYPDEQLQAYVQALGAQIAATTERPDLPWTFRVLDDDSINAFALPGGYIYVTRGIMAHFENEAQLVGVLGHEIAHVTAKHSVIRLSRSMLTELGFGIAQIFAPELEQIAPLAGAGLQLLFLRYSRADESEADRLGVRYMENVEENPRELMDVMQMLARVSEDREGGAIPQWASTHPLPENRAEAIRENIGNLKQENFRPVERKAYLTRLNGLVYGKDPREGYIVQSLFYHPQLKFQFQFPPEWQVINQERAVIGMSQGKDAALQITLSGHKTVQAAVNAFSRQEGLALDRTETMRINGLSAAVTGFQTRSGDGKVIGRAAFIEHGGRIYQIIGYSAPSGWQTYAGDIRNAISSFAEVTDPGILKVEPFRLEIVTVNEPATLRVFYDRHMLPMPLEEIARLNQMAPEDRLERGRQVKIVRGRRPVG
jgi:predicted Zn-dependent protease